ncbi:GNAT family N-acetyltransferase [Variovorax sp. KK3]|uniref:GNAT family N-acetyltransferase n=1 Tax=Variovorax sp. KK3 TaxID=1855728 RepID=UPI00097C10EC|nr:GNAT family N-acetyltransferase [Variovorax sp. KK3]
MPPFNTTPAAAIAATRRAVGVPRQVRLRNGAPALIRVVRPEDTVRFAGFVARLSPASRGERFGPGFGACSPAMLVDLVNADGVRQVAYVATVRRDQYEELIGEARYTLSGEGADAAAALTVAVADIWQGQGLAVQLLEQLVEAARDAGLRRLFAEVPATNRRMIRFMQRMGFVACAPEPGRPALRMERGVTPRPPLAPEPGPMDLLRRWLHNQFFHFGAGHSRVAS